MHRNRYTQEIGMESEPKNVPWPVACVLLGALAIGVWYGAKMLPSRGESHHGGAKAAVSEVQAAPSLAKH